MSSSPADAPDLRKISFSYLCIRLQRIREVKKHSNISIYQVRRNILLPPFMMKLWRSNPDDGSGDISPYMRLLLPHESHRNFGLKERDLASRLAGAVNRPSIKETLIKFSKQAAGGDFGIATEQAIHAGGQYSMFPNGYDPAISGATIQKALYEKRVRPLLTVSDVDNMLERLYEAYRSGSRGNGSGGKRAMQEAVLREAVRAMASWELRWFVNIILKNLNIKMDYRSILPGLHPDALTVFQSNTNLDEVCQSEVLKDSRRRAFSSVKPFNLIMPMLAYRVKQRKAKSRDEMRRACYDMLEADGDAAAGGRGGFGMAYGMLGMGMGFGVSTIGAGPIGDDNEDATKGCSLEQLADRHRMGFFVEDKLDGHRLLVHKRTAARSEEGSGGGVAWDGTQAASSSSSSSSSYSSSAVHATGAVAGNGVRSEILCLSRMRIEERRFCQVLQDHFRVCIRAGDAVVDGELLVVDAAGKAMDKQRLRPVAAEEIAAAREFRKMQSAGKLGGAGGSSSLSIERTGVTMVGEESPWASRASAAPGASANGGGDVPGGLPSLPPIDPLSEAFLAVRKSLADKGDSGTGVAGQGWGSSRGMATERRLGESGMGLADAFAGDGDMGGAMAGGMDQETEEVTAAGGSGQTTGGGAEDEEDSAVADEAGLHLEFVAFDVLYVDAWDEARMKRECGKGLLAYIELLRNTTGSKKGQLPTGDLTRLPQWYRMVLLRALMYPCKRRVALHEATWVSARAPDSVMSRIPAGAEDIDIMAAYLRRLFETASDAGLEGIMLKRADATYELGERSVYWKKLKPEYVEGAMDTLDLAVIGACYSDGKSRGRRGNTGLTHFILGCRVERPGEPLRFAPCGRVGTGYSFAELRDIYRRLQRCLVERVLPPGASRSGTAGSADLPKELFGRSAFAPNHQPDYYLDPRLMRNTVVMEVMATQVRPSEEFGSGFTMLFPRVQNVRRPVVEGAGGSGGGDESRSSSSAASGAGEDLPLVGIRDPRDKGPSQCTHVDEMRRILRERGGLLRSEDKARQLASGGRAGDALHGRFRGARKKATQKRKAGFASAQSFGVVGSNVPMLASSSSAGNTSAEAPLAGVSLFVYRHGGSGPVAHSANAKVQQLVGQLGATLVPTEAVARYVVIVNPRDAGAASIIADARRRYSQARAKAATKRATAMRLSDPGKREERVRRIDSDEKAVCNRDYLHVSWLEACAEAGQLAPVRWEQVILPSFVTRTELTRISDAFQDYYEEDATPESLERSLREVERQAMALAGTGRRTHSAGRKRPLAQGEDEAAVALLAPLFSKRRIDSSGSTDERLDQVLGSMLRAAVVDDEAEGATGERNKGVTASGIPKDLEFLSGPESGLFMMWAPLSMLSSGKRTSARGQQRYSARRATGEALDPVPRRLVVWFDSVTDSESAVAGNEGRGVVSSSAGSLGDGVRAQAWQETQQAELDCARTWLQSRGAAVPRDRDGADIVVEVCTETRMQAMANGSERYSDDRWVVGVDWVQACREAGAFVDVAKYCLGVGLGAPEGTTQEEAGSSGAGGAYYGAYEIEEAAGGGGGRASRRKSGSRVAAAPQRRTKGRLRRKGKGAWRDAKNLASDCD